MAIKTAKPVNGSEYHQKCKHCEIPVWSHAQNMQSSPTQSQLKPVKSQSPVHTHWLLQKGKEDMVLPTVYAAGSAANKW